MQQGEFMKKNLFLTAACLIVLALGSYSAAAQITITIPKIPIIKKDKPQKTEEQEKRTTETGGQAKENQTNGGKQASTNQIDNNCAEGGWMLLVTDDLTQIKKDFDKYTGRGYLYTNTPTYDYLLYAISPRAKQDWLKGIDRVEEGKCPGFVSAFDKMAASAVKVLPLLAPRSDEYTIKSPATENLLKSGIRNVSSLKIFRAGVKQASWLIEKNSIGIPTARYKHGMVWARNPADDHSYCHAYYINVVQDYAGGGTYGASYANFVADNIVPCPAGVK
jgi:hypothetical protein